MFNSPMSLARTDQLIEVLDLSSENTLAEFGCGNGAFLRRLASQYAIIGVGIDNNEALIQEANSQNDNDNIRFLSQDANEYARQMSPVDGMICIGSEYIFGGYQSFLDVAKNNLNDGGKLLVGIIFWKQAPSKDYLALLDGENPYFDLAQTVQFAYDAGFLPLGVYRSNDDEWDAFESSHSRKRYLETVTSGDESMQEDTWQWQRGYLTWGMATMGFCFLALQLK